MRPWDSTRRGTRFNGLQIGPAGCRYQQTRHKSGTHLHTAIADLLRSVPTIIIHLVVPGALAESDLASFPTFCHCPIDMKVLLNISEGSLRVLDQVLVVLILEGGGGDSASV